MHNRHEEKDSIISSWTIVRKLRPGLTKSCCKCKLDRQDAGKVSVPKETQLSNADNFAHAHRVQSRKNNNNEISMNTQNARRKPAKALFPCKTAFSVRTRKPRSTINRDHHSSDNLISVQDAAENVKYGWNISQETTRSTWWELQLQPACVCSARKHRQDASNVRCPTQKDLLRSKCVVLFHH